jgi:putative membrane protein
MTARTLQPRTRCTLTLAVAGTVAGLLLASPAGAAAAASSFDVVDRETVRALMDSSGTVTEAKLIEQLTILGNGTVVLHDPTSGRGVRDLDGFSAPAIKDGKAVYDVAVDGRKDLRTLSDYTGKLPVTVGVAYLLDGKPVKPADLVGKSGDLQVTYTVRNTTAAPTEVSYLDAAGKTVTKTVDVVVPFVGKVDTTLPSGYSQVDAPTAAVGGDGRGGTGLSFNMVLFPPIGTVEQVMTWRARVKDAVVPAVDITVVPASSKRTEVAAATSSFAGGAQSAGDLTVGAQTIDANLLKLQKGAGDLLAGLSQLAAGASTLSTGLNGKAAPGAKKLAAGAGTLAAGTGTLAAGTGELSAGAGQLAPGAAALADGAGTLADKLVLFQGGLTQLNDGISGLPSNPNLAKLQAGIAGLAAGIGGADKPGTVIFGLTQLKTAVSTGGKLKEGLVALQSGVSTLQGKLADAASTSIPGLQAKAANAFAKLTAVATANSCVAPGSGLCADILPALQDSGYLASALDGHAPGALAGGNTALDPGGLQYQLGAASQGLTQMLSGVGQLLVGIDAHSPGTYGATDTGGMLYALNALLLGLDAHTPGTYGATDRGGVLYGLGAVSAGVDALVQTVVATVTGALGSSTSDPLTTLRGGAAALSAGADLIAGGAGEVADGAGQLADGADALNSGAGKLKAGAGQLATGAKELSTGLGSAADGAGKIADGLGKAAPGAKKIQDGAGRLSKEGTSVLATKGAETQASNAEKAATLVAMGHKVDGGALPYGAPEGAVGTAVYKLQLAAETKATNDNAARSAAIVGLLALAGLGSVVLRRRVTS